MNNQRQIRYYLKISTDDQNPMPHHWFFYIQNTRTEINRIQDRILKQLAMCDNLTTLESETIIPSQSILARLIHFDSQKGKIENPGKIYKSSNFKEDRNLHPMTEEKFEKYYTKFI